MIKSSNSSFGYFYIFLCCFTNAFSFVFISHSNKTHDEMLNIFMTFGYATIFFNIFNFKKLITIYSSVVKNFKVLFYMNIATLFNWLGSFLSLNYIDPATALCLNLGLIAVTNFFILTPLNKFRKNKHLIAGVVFILISMILIIKQHMNTNLHTSTKIIALGVFWSVVGGFAGGFIGINSEHMGKVGFSPTQILASRFYLLIIVSGILLNYTSHLSPLIIDFKYYILSSIIIVFFPLLMYQTAIKSLGALIVSLLEPLTPVITYFLQVWIGDYRFNVITVVLLLIASSAIIWLVRVEKNMTSAKLLLD